MNGLSNSRWAAKDARSNSVPAPLNRTFNAGSTKISESTAVHLSRPAVRSESAAAELARYSKIVRRMKWKLPFLDEAYSQAVSLDRAAVDKAEAELMFKLDFFEYYMLCERALVHLQGVFGITITRDFVASTRTATIRGGKGAPTHRYHANVLEALDKEDNPLHGILGSGDVRWQLARAKDLRNRWKNADDESSTASGGRKNKAEPLPLSSYDLAGILATIHEGLDHAFVVASDFVAAESACYRNSRLGDPHTDSVFMGMEGTTEEEEWGFMVEAMDWEAV